MSSPELSQRSTADSDAAAPTPAREWSTTAFLGFLGVVTCVYGAVLIYHIVRPPGSVAANDNLLEQCRQICLKYGLVSSGNVKQDAEAFLVAAKSRPLNAALHEILTDSEFVAETSQSHPLLNESAPDFTLNDESGREHSLKSLGENRPLIVVFYLGYGCSHCVAQLLALDKDLHSFRELDAEIVAISQDSIAHTAERFKEFGRFGFPVLSDPDNATAAQWGVFVAETEMTDETHKHGTFVVDRSGKVIWATIGNEPFLDNRSLLHVIARSQGLMPTSNTPQDLLSVDP